MVPSPNRLRSALVMISAATVASGATQMLAPGLMLRLLKCPDTPADRQFFGTIGMFMIVMGGSLLDALVVAWPLHGQSVVRLFVVAFRRAAPSSGTARSCASGCPSPSPGLE